MSEKDYVYIAVFEVDDTLTLNKEAVGWTDSMSNYIIKADGSAINTTAWNSESFPRGSFTDIYQMAKKIFEKTQYRAFMQKDAEELMKKVEKRIEFIKVTSFRYKSQIAF